MGSIPSDLAPISTTTWVAVIFSTVPLMTLSSRAASSLSVVKLSSAEAKSSAVEGFSSIFCASICAGGGDWWGDCWDDWDETLFTVKPSRWSAGCSATEVAVAESRSWAVVSSDKVDGLSRVYLARGCGDGCGAV